jgi:hypothetical protein
MSCHNLSHRLSRNPVLVRVEMDTINRAGLGDASGVEKRATQVSESE